MCWALTFRLHPGCSRLYVVEQRSISAGGRRLRTARPEFRILHDSGIGRADDGAQMDHVPNAPPRDQGGDAERARYAILFVDDPGVRDLEIANSIVANTGRHPVPVARWDVDSYELG